MKIAASALSAVCRPRFYSSTSLNVGALDRWIADPKQLIVSGTISTDHMADLFITLPTRDGTRGRAYTPPRIGAPMGYGHHFALFQPRRPESELRPDGTDADFCPPEPYTRRMWAGGKIAWSTANPLLVGDYVTSTSTVTRVEKKGFERGSPTVFVTQKIEIQKDGAEEASLVEERSHVYLVKAAANQGAREVKDLPAKADFTFTYTPSLITLFRYSALMFNAHLIHLDKDFTQKVGGYPERLVHGPLTALMLLETAVLQRPDGRITSFEYRARNPVIVGKELTINGLWNGGSAKLWTIDEAGVVGMTGTVYFE